MENEMNLRVLSRKGARVITTEEALSIGGGIGPVHPTVSVCTFDIRVGGLGGSDGDTAPGDGC